MKSAAAPAVPALPGWFGPRASVDDPAVTALVERVAPTTPITDLGGAFNLNLRLDFDSPAVLRVHRPWVPRWRIAGLRRLRERLRSAGSNVARPIPVLGRDVVRVGDRWAELEEFVPNQSPIPGRNVYIRLFIELGRLHCALGQAWAEGRELLDDYPAPITPASRATQLRWWLGFTRRRLGPAAEPVVKRAGLLMKELAAVRRGVHLPHGPIHGDYKLGNVVELSDGSWCNLDLDFVRWGERISDVAGSLHWAFESGESLAFSELLDAYESTAPTPLTAVERGLLPAVLAQGPLYWVITASLTGTVPQSTAGRLEGVADAEAAMDSAERWWSKREGPL